MYPEFWLKNWSIPSTDSAVKLQELVRLGYEHAVARAEASARMARSLSACRTPFDAIAVYQDWIVAESQRIVGDMRRMAELSKALLESTGQSLSSPVQAPMIAAADAMMRADRETATAAAEEAPAAKPVAEPAPQPKPVAEAAIPATPPVQVAAPAAQAAKPVAPATPVPPTPAPQAAAPVAAAPVAAAPVTTAEAPTQPAAAPPATPPNPGPVNQATAGQPAEEAEEGKGRRKRKPAAAE